MYKRNNNPTGWTLEDDRSGKSRAADRSSDTEQENSTQKVWFWQRGFSFLFFIALGKCDWAQLA